MDDLERRLKSLSLGGPSEGLRERIFDAADHEAPRRAVHSPRRLRPRGVPFAWAAAAAVFCTVFGYAAGSLRSTPPATASAPASIVKVEIVKTTNPHDMFDFTAPVNDFLPGNLNISIKPDNEV